MKLENELKQRRAFVNPYQKAGVNLIYTHNWLVGKMKAFFRKYEITSKQFNILRILKGAGEPVSTSYIKERLLDRHSDVSRIVDRMHEKFWVQKSVCSIDKRLIDVKLTSEGESILSLINADMTKMENVLSALSEEEIVQLNALLDKVRG